MLVLSSGLSFTKPANTSLSKLFISDQYLDMDSQYLSSTRMCISYEFQRYIPLVTA